MTIVKPRTPSGFPEYTPEDQIEFNRLIDIIKTTYELYGFTPLEMDLYGADYSSMVIENANGLGEHLAACGIVPTMAINGRYTNTHQIHVPIDKYGKSYTDLYDRFYESRLAVAFDVDPYGCRFIRLGLQEITRRGIDSSGLELLAHTISQILTDYQPEACGKNISSIKQSLGGEIKYSFDKGVA
jgi:hypothetical protein cdivTM_07796